MVAYNFHRRWVEKLRSREKRRTIRAVGKKKHVQAGEEVQLYTGMRSPACELIARETCRSNLPILMDFRIGLVSVGLHSPVCFVGEELDAFAKLDGFVDWPALKQFFKEQHDVDFFTGVMIQW